MNEILLALALSMTKVPYALSEPAVSDVIAATEDEPCLPLGSSETCIENTRRLVLVWMFRESAFKVDAVGDGGNSIGAMQTNKFFLRGRKSSEVLTSRQVAIKVWLGWVRFGIEKCSSLERGLGLLASGFCGGGRALVVRRCKEAGVSCSQSK